MTTNIGQRRAPDIEVRDTHPNFAQCNNTLVAIPMGKFWIEICYSNTGDRTAAFTKIAAHVPTINTLFVAIVLINKLTPASINRVSSVHGTGAAPVPPA